MESPKKIAKRIRGDVALNSEVRTLRKDLESMIERSIVEGSTAALEPIETELRVLSSAVAEANRRISELQSTMQGLIVGSVSLSTDPALWKEKAQTGELAFHKTRNIRSRPDWAQGNELFWKRHGFDSEGWSGKFIVDVGAGSRLRTLYFKGASIAVVEPLANQFIEEVEWQDLSQAAEIYPVPAEIYIPELHRRADLLVSVNALDHGYQFEQCIQNIAQYLKEDGRAWLSFDQHEEPDDMHPLRLNDTIAREVFSSAGLEVERFDESGQYHKGLPASSLHYWLRLATGP